MVSELETGMENEIKPKIEELKRQLEENATGTGTVTEKQSDAVSDLVRGRCSNESNESHKCGHHKR